MANERRIYKNYYLTDRIYVDISNASIVKNADKISMVEDIQVWPKTPYLDGARHLEIITTAGMDEERVISIKTPGLSIKGRKVMAIVTNGLTPTDRVNVTLIGKNGERMDYMVNFFVDRWLKLLVDISDMEFYDIEEIVLTFSRVKGYYVEHEYIYVGEVSFGNIIDFQFEHDITGYVKTDADVKQEKGSLIWSFDKKSILEMPRFENARYSVLNSIIYIKDNIKISLEGEGCKDYRIYITTTMSPDFSEAYSHDFHASCEGLETVLVQISDLIKDESERLTGIRIESTGKGKLVIHDISFVQERDFLLDDIGAEYIKRKPVEVTNPYKFDVPNIIYNVRDFGAKGDFFTNDTDAFRKAALCAKETGGIVLVPEGRYVLTNVTFYSNTELRLEEGSLLVQSTDESHYDYPVAYEHDNINYTCEWAHNFLVHNKPMLYWNHAHNIKITGKGKIRMADTGSERLMGAYPYYDIHCNSLIHAVPIVLNFCSNVEVSGITINRANSYHIFFAHCTETFVNEVKLFDPRCLSGDGLGFNSGHNIFVSNVMFVSNDDGITLNPGYDDPRGHTSYFDQTPEQDNSIYNVEICHSYINSAYGAWGKALAFIPWGKCASNQEWSLTRDVYVHDCILKGGCAVGTWCDDPFHGKVPFDNSELDDYSPISDITLENNTYIGPCDLMEIQVTNMKSDCNLHSSYGIVNGKFKDGRCNWKSESGLIIDYREERANMKNGDDLYQIIYSKKGNNEFSFRLIGKGELFIEDYVVPFEAKEETEVKISKEYDTEKNIRVGIRSESNTVVFEIKRI